jgi:hypothetical protein
MPKRKSIKDVPKELIDAILESVRKTPWSTVKDVYESLEKQKIKTKADTVRNVLYDAVDKKILTKEFTSSIGLKFAFPEIMKIREERQQIKIDIVKLPWIKFPTSVAQCEELLEDLDRWMMSNEPNNPFTGAFILDLEVYVKALQKRYVNEEKGS